DNDKKIVICFSKNKSGDSGNFREGSCKYSGRERRIMGRHRLNVEDREGIATDHHPRSEHLRLLLALTVTPAPRH
ncbi:hypothetical protein CU098_000427, partial [Rhizopus stolonifer]